MSENNEEPLKYEYEITWFNEASPVTLESWKNLSKLIKKGQGQGK